MMRMKLDVEGVRVNIVCAYALQTGCEKEEKERFQNKLDHLIETLQQCERSVPGAVLNGHVGRVNIVDKNTIGKYGVKQRNLEWQTLVDFARRMSLAVVNTFFQNKVDHRIT